MPPNKRDIQRWNKCYDVTQSEKWKFLPLVMKIWVTIWAYSAQATAVLISIAILILYPYPIPSTSSARAEVPERRYGVRIFDDCLFPYRICLASNGCNIHLLGFHQWNYFNYYQFGPSRTISSVKCSSTWYISLWETVGWKYNLWMRIQKK